MFGDFASDDRKTNCLNFAIIVTGRISWYAITADVKARSKSI